MHQNPGFKEVDDDSCHDVMADTGRLDFITSWRHGEKEGWRAWGDGEKNEVEETYGRNGCLDKPDERLGC